MSGTQNRQFHRPFLFGLAALGVLPQLIVLAVLFAASPGGHLVQTLMALFASFGLAILAVLFAALPALGFALYTSDVAKAPMRRFLCAAMDSLGGIPPVAVALAFGLLAFYKGLAPSLPLAALLVCVASLPRLCLSCAQTIRAVPSEHLLAATSMGMSHIHTVFYVTARLTWRPLASIFLRTMAFAINQVALLQLALGFSPGLMPYQGTRPLSALALQCVQNADLPTAALCAFLLFAVNAALFSAAHLLHHDRAHT